MNRHPSRLTYILLGILLFGAGLFFWVYVQLSAKIEFPETRFGITFSSLYTRQLGLNVQETFDALIDGLGVKAVRLPIYWSEVEKTAGMYDWQEMDWLTTYAQEHQVALTLVVGSKVPRWPECFIPDWAERLGRDDQQKAVLSFMETAVRRYQSFKTVERWQVENEPFFPYGECPTLTRKQFEERVALVRRLDPFRPIQVTVSGELALWKSEADVADILGISMYRLAWNELFGYFVYPLTPEYYSLRAQFVRDRVDQVIVSELQAEPWFSAPIDSRPRTEWYSMFDERLFQKNIQFVKEAHLPEVYLWGAEWWYALKKEGEERLWNVAKVLYEKK